MITSVDSEKVFNKFQKQILIKCLKKLGTEQLTQPNKGQR